jgi:hypothetical protein
MDAKTKQLYWNIYLAHLQKKRKRDQDEVFRPLEKFKVFEDPAKTSSIEDIIGILSDEKPMINISDLADHAYSQLYAEN